MLKGNISSVLPVVLYVFEILYLAFREWQNLGMFENMMLSKIFGLKIEKD